MNAGHRQDDTLRFEFGKNWKSFLELLDEERIRESERAIRRSLNVDSLAGWRVLDIGSGSGLSSLAMRRLGAQVVSFDFDPASVACTTELRRRYGFAESEWEILQGSALDARFMAERGQFDLVYAWGVLHHTGEMWRAIKLAQERVGPGGRLLIALYNDQGWRSVLWRRIKRVYCTGWLGRAVVGGTFYPLFACYAIGLDLLRWQLPGTHMRRYVGRRGMSIFHDWRDWLGGYPFEVASPDSVRQALASAGFRLEQESLTKGWGCNEFVFSREA